MADQTTLTMPNDDKNRNRRSKWLKKKIKSLRLRKQSNKENEKEAAPRGISTAQFRRQNGRGNEKGTPTSKDSTSRFSPHKKCQRMFKSIGWKKTHPSSFGDDDIWMEIVLVNCLKGKKCSDTGARLLFYSMKTGVAVIDEPPAGSSRVIPACDDWRPLLRALGSSTTSQGADGADKKRTTRNIYTKGSEIWVEIPVLRKGLQAQVSQTRSLFFALKTRRGRWDDPPRRAKKVILANGSCPMDDQRGQKQTYFDEEMSYLTQSTTVFDDVDECISQIEEDTTRSSPEGMVITIPIVTPRAATTDKDTKQTAEEDPSATVSLLGILIMFFVIFPAIITTTLRPTAFRQYYPEVKDISHIQDRDNHNFFRSPSNDSLPANLISPDVVAYDPQMDWYEREQRSRGVSCSLSL
mmetsp:Transcript_68699/g.102116  ORF Transcript_68699/g.102116 Transcript_68699/m.102116 type:complete len:409 (+) Transcript_68699:38-1264(+)